jgi:hypothetical protein
MIEPSKIAVAAREQAEKLLSAQQRHQSTYEQEIAILERHRRAEDEKTARLRALRLAKEAAEAQGQRPPTLGKGRKRSAGL